MDRSYTKLSNLIDETFVVIRVAEHQYKMWSPSESKMLISESPQKGYRKMYTIETDKGLMDVSAGQLGQILEAAQYKGKVDISNKTFSVGANMTADEFSRADKEEKMKIRYYFNLAKDEYDQTPDGEW